MRMSPQPTLILLLSSLIDVPNVTVQCRLDGEPVSFVGPITSIHFKSAAPLVFIETQSGERGWVSLDDLEIRIHGNSNAADQPEPEMMAIDRCLAICDGRVCQKAAGHQSPHDWEAYPLG